MNLNVVCLNFLFEAFLLQPCGHSLCGICNRKIQQKQTCPRCKQQICSTTPIIVIQNVLRIMKPDEFYVYETNKTPLTVSLTIGSIPNTVEYLEWVCFQRYNEIDYDETVRLLEPLASQGFPLAEYIMAKCYIQVPEKANQWYKLAFYHAQNYSISYISNGAIIGDTGQYVLALCYLNGHGVERDYDEAHSLCEDAAYNGHIGAQYGMTDGKMFQSDLDNQRYWLEKIAMCHTTPFTCASWQHHEALFRLGEICTDPDEANQWFKKAHEHGKDNERWF